jgi:hypothetical protein
MDLHALMVVLVLSGITAIPFILMWRTRRKTQGAALAQLQQAAAAHGAVITRFEHGYDFTIGLDENRNVAFFLKQRNAEATIQEVDLHTVSDCRVQRGSRKSADGGNYLSLDRIALVFPPHTSGVEDTTFTFFTSEDRVQPAMDLEQAETWAQVLKERIGK